MAQVDAVGYWLVGLKFKTADVYPRGDILSAPVKKASTIPRETLCT